MRWLGKAGLAALMVPKAEPESLGQSHHPLPRVAVATCAAGLTRAIDGVTAETDNTRRMREGTLGGLRCGFGGKLCSHPRQVAIVHQSIAPTEQEPAWARRVSEADVAAGGAEVQVDGRMVDLPAVLRATGTLVRAVTWEEV